MTYYVPSTIFTGLCMWSFLQTVYFVAFAITYCGIIGYQYVCLFFSILTRAAPEVFTKEEVEHILYQRERKRKAKRLAQI